MTAHASSSSVHAGHPASPQQPALKHAPAWASDLPDDVPTPALIVSEAGVLANLGRTAQACGGVGRLMPHVKTHRAPWIVRLLLEQGVTAFKAATVAEVAMTLEAGARHVVWAYPTVNRANLHELLALAARHPEARIAALVDSLHGLRTWSELLAQKTVPNLHLIVDLDVGMGRTGASLADGTAFTLACELQALGCFGGWHAYDGHIHDRDPAVRRTRVQEGIEAVQGLLAQAGARGLSTQLIAGGSYSFDVWPRELATFVSPGSFVYSSSEHDADLAPLSWTPSAYVLATVISQNGGTVTLDAGAKAIAPDKPLRERFAWPGAIRLMSEEHVVVESAGQGLRVGDQVMLMPRHACTTAYLFDSAVVRARDGGWDVRPQLGSRR
ncbi:alanine racemase [Caballeronia sp. LZ043]|uniref:alanine racemase n=1 Tax=Caballeronia sp. LZ043 TaxID=3038569 RepID=UPI002859A1A4|nr:alanine racemase [Caballeronia sp. LZ043]MDR5822334.1 alanine racemase [Caballeronia sp. LZ043]